MEWTDIPGMDQASIDKLYAAGIANAAALAGVEDEAALAQRAGLPAAKVEAFCASARQRVESLLEANGVGGPDALARADPHALALATGLPEAQLAAFVQAARAATGYEVPPPALVASNEPDAVLLREDSDRARVRMAGAVREDVAIVTARADEDADAALARAAGDAVLLQDKAAHAKVRLDGQVLPPLPIYRLRASGAEGPAEERVRVAALKEEGAPKGPRLLGRFLGKKG